MSNVTFVPVLDKAGNPTGVEAAIDGEYLLTRAKIAPKPSKSFKNVLLATTSGNHQIAGLTYDGKPITLSQNAYVPPTRK